jgi:hypothetical protein
VPFKFRSGASRPVANFLNLGLKLWIADHRFDVSQSFVELGKVSAR